MLLKEKVVLSLTTHSFVCMTPQNAFYKMKQFGKEKMLAK